MTSITVQQLAASAGATIIDVREPDEYAAGHARSAVNVPLSEPANASTGSPRTGPCTSSASPGAAAPEPQRRSPPAASTPSRSPGHHRLD